MLDNKVLDMSPGEVLLDAPVAETIQKLGIAIAEAQLRLDQTSVRVATLLSEAKVDFKDANGKSTTKSLLELGFTPTFYHFSETELEVKMTLTMKVEEEFRIGGEVNIGNAVGKKAKKGDEGKGGNEDAGETDEAKDNQENKEIAKPSNRASLFGATINAEYHRKYEFDVTGSSMIKTKMIAIPAPTAFLEAIKDNARSGGSMTAS